MKRHSTSVLAWILFAGSSVAWYFEPTRKVDWIPLFVLSLIVMTIDKRLKDIQKRLDKLEEPPKE